MVYSAGEELEVDQQPPAPILLGRHLLEIGLQPGPRNRRDHQGGLRAATGRQVSARSMMQKLLLSRCYPQIPQITQIRRKDC